MAAEPERREGGGVLAQARRGLGVQWVSLSLILLLMCVVIGWRAPNFWKAQNLADVARNFSFIAIMASGMMMIITSGGIDLSVGSMLALCGVLTAWSMLSWGLPVPLAALFGLVCGAACGCVNGLLVTRVRVPPFVATLGTMSIFRSLALVTTGGGTLRQFSDTFMPMGQGTLGGVPWPVLVMVLVAIAGSLFLGLSRGGRYLYAIGGNEAAARLSGVAVDSWRLLYYTLAGLLTGCAAVLFTARFGVAQSTAGLGYELDVIAATVVGGVSLSGGEGTIIGAVLGAAIIGVLSNALVLLGVSPFWIGAVRGGVIIAAVALDTLRGGGFVQLRRLASFRKGGA